MPSSRRPSRPAPADTWRAARRARWLARLAALITRLVPRHLGYWLTDRAGSLTYLAARQQRLAVLANLSQITGRPTSDPQVRQAARHCFQTSARNFWDLCSLPHTRRDALWRRTTIDPAAWQHLSERHAEGRGLIIVTAHLGAFDYVTQLLTRLPSPFMILTAQTTSRWLFECVTELRRGWGALVEPVTPGALRRMVGHLRAGNLIGLVADRDFYHSGRPVWLCGRQTTLPVGPVRLALETGAPLIVIACPRQGDGYQLVIEELPIQRTGHLQHDIDLNLAALATLLEAAIRRWPDQWVMFQRAWPPTPSADGIHLGHLGSP